MYGPAGLSICCNICLFVLTSMKLCQHEINMRRDFGDSRDSECHNHNKTWFAEIMMKIFSLYHILWHHLTGSVCIWSYSLWWGSAGQPKRSRHFGSGRIISGLLRTWLTCFRVFLYSLFSSVKKAFGCLSRNNTASRSYRVPMTAGSTTFSRHQATKLRE